MSKDEYPEDIEIKKTNFKTDQQEEAAEVIEAEWPIGLDTLAEEEGHVEMFYSQVLDQFLGPADAEMTFKEIQSEYGSVEQWADGQAPEDDVDVPDADEIEPGEDDEETEADGDADAGTEADGEVESSEPASVDAGSAGAEPDPSTDDATSPESSGEGATVSAGNGGLSAAELSVSPAAGATSGEGDVDERRRQWFAAGFREGVEFALRNPELFGRERGSDGNST